MVGADLTALWLRPSSFNCIQVSFCCVFLFTSRPRPLKTSVRRRRRTLWGDRSRGRKICPFAVNRRQRWHLVLMTAAQLDQQPEWKRGECSTEPLLFLRLKHNMLVKQHIWADEWTGTGTGSVLALWIHPWINQAVNKMYFNVQKRWIHYWFPSINSAGYCLFSNWRQWSTIFQIKFKTW